MTPGSDPTPDAPGDEADAGLGGDLSNCTDEQWLAGHSLLIALQAVPAEETRFLYEPGRDPATVTVDDLTEDGRSRG